VNQPQTPREFCAALAAMGIDASPTLYPYAQGDAGGRPWSLFGPEGGSGCRPDEPMNGPLWLEFYRTDEEGGQPLGYLENCTAAQAIDAIWHVQAGDYSDLTPFELSIAGWPRRRWQWARTLLQRARTLLRRITRR
jgi:hypothetical protein